MWFSLSFFLPTAFETQVSQKLVSFQSSVCLRMENKKKHAKRMISNTFSCVMDILCYKNENLQHHLRSYPARTLCKSS